MVLTNGPAKFRQIPTIPTDLQQVQETAMRALAKLDKVDFPALVSSMTGAASSIHDLASSESVKQTIVALRETALNLNKTAITLQATVANVNSKIDPLVSSLQKTSDHANMTLAAATGTLTDLQSTIRPGSPFSYQLNETVEEMGDASRSIRELADFLERDPSAVVRGKYAPANEDE